MKKKVLLLATCFLILSTNAFAELTQSDLEKIDKLIQASETRIKEYVDLKISGLDGRLTQIYGFVIALVVLIAMALGLPQILVARQGKEIRTQDQRIEALQQEIETLKQEHTA